MNILNKLTIKHLKMNKKRTIVSIIGIILSTALMVGIGLLLSSFREAMITDVKQYNGDYNAKIKDVESYRLSVIENNTNVDKTIYRGYIGYSKMNDETFDLYKLFGVNDDYMKHFNLIEGELPSNDNEIVISSYLRDRPNSNLKVGDTLKLNIGDRYVGKEPVKDLTVYNEGEYLKDTVLKSYKIVGVIDRDIYEDGELGCFIYTKSDNQDKLDVFVTYKNVSKTYKYSKGISTALGIKYNSDEYYSRVSYNITLLSLYGASSYNNLMSGMSSMLAIMLGLVSVACVIVIYNSFAISVMERKKQFGLFSSIGATRSQLRKTVLYEGLIVSVIGIPLGILSAYLGIGVVLVIMNNLLKDAINLDLTLTTYPLFIIIPIIFMIITIFISAFIPAKKASKISPIEAIRLNDDIKIKGKKVKSPKWIRKMFGVEGDIAYKNMKRNKKKYRITVISLFISIVMFISFSGFMQYSLFGINGYISVPKLDIALTYNPKNCDQKVIDDLRKNVDVKKSSEFSYLSFYTESDISKLNSDRYTEFLNDNGFSLNQNDVAVIVLSDDDFKDYIKSFGKNEEKPVLYNNYNGIIYGENSRKSYNIDKYNNDTMNIDLAVATYNDTSNSNEMKDVSKTTYVSTISDFYVSSKEFFGLDLYAANRGLNIVLSDSMANEYNLYKNYEGDINKFVMIEAPSYKNFSKAVDEYKEKGKMDNISYENIREEMKVLKNFVLAVKILVYGFIALVTLIGITSVFNTINTSIALRRKEFAVLRSIGLTPKGFNKTLRFESLFFGLKSLVYAIPTSIVIVYFMYLSMKNIIEMKSILMPWGGILISVVGVFVVITISMTYATKKVKHDNILDAIREENI